MEDNKEKIKDKPENLAEEYRIKVLSPGMMVYKRFIRNRLAILGFAILIAMILFSFLGGIVMPYGQAQVFRKIDYVNLDFATATYNREYRYTVSEGMNFDAFAQAQFLLAVSKGEESFSAGNTTYYIEYHEDELCVISGYNPLIEADVLRTGSINFKPNNTFTLSPAMEEAFTAAYRAGDDYFNFNGKSYAILRRQRNWAAIAERYEYAVASMRAVDYYDAADAADVGSFGFRLAAERAMGRRLASFEWNGRNFTVDMIDENSGTVYKEDGRPYAEISEIIVSPMDKELFLPMEFRHDVREAVSTGAQSFNSGAMGGDEEHYTVMVINTLYTIKSQQLTEIFDLFSPPSRAHPLGTDANGMDLLTRLMYGGRISLTVGFVVILIELIIGVIFGGISGYFSGWVDTLMMRFVDLFNAIPMLPMIFILATILDAYRVEAMTRIYLLMAFLGIMGWTGIARVVRGQILTLREQDFMTAAEASGLKVSRRIFKHLVPNVMPLLIVNATMGLGSIILTEATLSFMGLGIKYPLASWGAVANAAIDINIMRFYPFTWIPAGVLIFLTVLGFNFVGDGLRDAFDPKMKR